MKTIKIYSIILILIIDLSISFELSARSIYNVITETYLDEELNTLPNRTVETDENGLTVTYNFENIGLIENRNYSNTINVEINGFGQNTKSKQYSYPIRLDYISIPSGMYPIVELINWEYVEISEQLAPAIRSVLENDSNEYISSNINFNELIMPEQKVEFFSYENGFLRVLVKPLGFNQNELLLQLPKVLSYRVNFVPLTNLNTQELKSTKSREWINDVSLNPEVYFSESSIPAEVIPEGYIILGSSKYKKAIERFSEWKKTIGFETRISLKENWTTNEIKTQIAQECSTLQNPKYLLIFGDHQDVPAVEVDTVIAGEQMKYVSDYSYSFVNHDEIGIPDLLKGRLPVQNTDEADKVVDKIINFEKNPTTEKNFYNHGAIASYFQDEPEYEHTQLIAPPDGREDRRFIETSEQIRNYLEERNKNIERIYYALPETDPKYWENNYFSFGGEIPIELQKPNFNWDGNSKDIISQFNKGISFFLYRGHGDWYKWVNPELVSWDLDQIDKSNKLPFVFHINCKTGNFKKNCLAEKMIRMENCAIGCFAASWDSFSKPNDALACGLFDAIWPNPGLVPNFRNASDNITIYPRPTYIIGEIIERALLRMEETFPLEERVYQRMIYHYFGDPSMYYTTDIPTSFENVKIVRGADNISINTGAEPAKIVIYDKENNNIKVYDSQNIVYNTTNSENISISISGHNKVPYIEEVNNGGTIYIQNEIISSDRTYRAERIIIGNSVDNSRISGPVVFEKGKINMYAKEILFENDVEIKMGVELNTIELK